MQLSTGIPEGPGKKQQIQNQIIKCSSQITDQNKIRCTGSGMILCEVARPYPTLTANYTPYHAMFI